MLAMPVLYSLSPLILTPKPAVEAHAQYKSEESTAVVTANPAGQELLSTKLDPLDDAKSALIREAQYLLVSVSSRGKMKSSPKKPTTPVAGAVPVMSQTFPSVFINDAVFDSSH